MGAGYYLGESKYSGWIIEKSPIYDRKNKIDEFAYVAGCPDGIYINKGNDNNTSIQEQKELTLQFESDNLSFEIVDYSEKAIALSTYAYNIRSWTKSITSPLFTQTLYYNDVYGGSTKQYNGNIGAMSWKTQD